LGGDAGQAKVLGSVYIPDSDLCFIKLRGGENACKGTQTLAMRNADSGRADRDWDISVREGEAGPETKIAHLAVNDQHQLTFQWQPEAASSALAPYLKNCAFSMNCAGESHVVTMREATQEEGMAVDFEKSVSKEDWLIELCPEPESVRIEILGIEGAKCTVEPAPVLKANRAEALVRIEDGGNMLTLRLETSLRRTLQVTAEPYIKSSPDVKEEKFSSRALKEFLRLAPQQQQAYAGMVQDGQRAMANRSIPDTEKRRTIQPRLALVEQQQTAFETLLGNMQKLDELLKSLEGKMQIKFRVFYDADSSEVELLRIGA
jgi:hypothetical protein